MDDKSYTAFHSNENEVILPNKKKNTAKQKEKIKQTPQVIYKEYFYSNYETANRSEILTKNIALLLI